MPELYPYQSQTIDELDAGFEDHLRQIAVLPTGGGKTVLFSEIARRAVEAGKVVLVLTDRVELFNSACDSIAELQIPVCKINRGNNNIYVKAQMFAGMVECVARRLPRLAGIKFDLIIIDECHRGNFFKILDAYPDVRTIGFTATPIHKKLHLYYTNMINVIDIPELIEKGYLVPCHPYEMKDDFSDIETDAEEFEEAALVKHYNNQRLFSGVLSWYNEVCKGRKTIIFNVNVWHSDAMAAEFEAAGIQSYSITSNTSEADRKIILEKFSRGDFQVLNNCGILTTGYNEPTIEAVIINRATKSLALWLQMQGRGSRTCPRINKKNFVVVDFGMNHSRLGEWEEPRMWDLSAPKPKKSRTRFASEALTMNCVNSSCKAVMSVRSARCKVCGQGSGADFLPPLSAGVLVDLKKKIPVPLVDRYISDLSVSELVDLQKTGLHTEKSITRVMLSRGVSAVEEYASLCDKPDAWLTEQTSIIHKNQREGIKITYSNYKVKQIQ